jgi:hypothetical protein
MGCDLGQGYLIGRPAPADELLQLFEAPRLVPLSVAQPPQPEDTPGRFADATVGLRT